MRARELLPWRNFVIGTSWSPDIAIVEIQKRVGVRGFLDMGGGSEPFAGRLVNGNEFHFSRRISYRNSFLPVISATVEPSHREGARIRVTMRMNLFVMVFMTIWMTGATFGGVTVFVAALASGQWVGTHRVLLTGVRHRHRHDSFRDRSAQGRRPSERNLRERARVAGASRDRRRLSVGRLIRLSSRDFNSRQLRENPLS
jgi:hypothetical protein